MMKYPHLVLSYSIIINTYITNILLQASFNTSSNAYRMMLGVDSNTGALPLHRDMGTQVKEYVTR